MTPVLAPSLRTDRSFERIYRRHVGDVYRYALAVLHNRSDAEDVTQTTFLNAYRAFQRGERPRNAQNWLIAIAHNVCRQRFRQAQRRPEEVAYDDGIGETPRDDEERAPTAEDIQRALSHLAFNQRAALVMRELEGRSYDQIAEILGLSVSAVETLLFRARRALREQLEGTLTCVEAERAISRRADGQLPRSEHGALRAHLRECRECERLARSQRAQRTAFKALALVPIPSSLTGLFGGGAAGGAIAVKAAALVAAGVAVTGVGVEGAQRLDRSPPAEARAAAPAVAAQAPIVVQDPTPFQFVAPAQQAAKPKANASAKAKVKAAKDATPAVKAKAKKAKRLHAKVAGAKTNEPKLKPKQSPQSSAHAVKAPHAKPPARPKKAKPAQPVRTPKAKAPKKAKGS